MIAIIAYLVGFLIIMGMFRAARHFGYEHHLDRAFQVYMMLLTFMAALNHRWGWLIFDAAAVLLYQYCYNKDKVRDKKTREDRAFIKMLKDFGKSTPEVTIIELKDHADDPNGKVIYKRKEDKNG